MRNYLRYSVVLAWLAVVAVVILPSCGKSANELPPLRETYLDRDDAPFGSSVFSNLLPSVFSQSDVENEKTPVLDEFSDISENAANSVYISLSKKLFLDEYEAQRIIDYVKNGNQAYFISAEIDENLLGLVNINQVGGVYENFNGWDTAYQSNISLATDSSRKYPLVSYGFRNFFELEKAYNSQILGYNENGKPNFVVVFMGKGKLFLHCDAKACSNYFLLSRTNHDYMNGLFEYSPKDPQKVYYDQYYKTLTRRRQEGEENFSTLQEIFKSPALTAAFFIGLGAILLFILFGLKRRQKMIKVIPPNINSSVSYTETMGRLYFQNNNNKDLAEKIVVYFNEQIRVKYFINKGSLEKTAYWELLGRKSGVSKDIVEDLSRQIDKVTMSTNVSDTDLLLLNHLIQKFYQSKNKK